MKTPLPQSTLAPSEKHLEDWIVANPSLFAPFRNTPLLDAIIARQVNYRSGVIDLIGMKEHRLRVIELKKGEIDAKALTQLLGYIQQVRRIFNDVACDLWNTKQVKNLYGFTLEGHEFVGGILVGNSIDLKTHLACEEAGILCMIYEFDGSSYQFDYSRWPIDETYTPTEGLMHLAPLFEHVIFERDARDQEAAS